jgi:hypothetical protein
MEKKIWATNNLACAGPTNFIPTATGTDQHKTGTDRPELFYDVFDKNFQNFIPFWAINYKTSIKNVIKIPVPSLSPSSPGRLMPVTVPVKKP